MNLIALEYTDTRQVRTIQINDETWFVVSGICDILNLGTITRVVLPCSHTHVGNVQVKSARFGNIALRETGLK
jgi:prophage antirepressor-like protein